MIVFQGMDGFCVFMDVFGITFSLNNPFETILKCLVFMNLNTARARSFVFSLSSCRFLATLSNDFTFTSRFFLRKADFAHSCFSSDMRPSVYELAVWSG